MRTGNFGTPTQPTSMTMLSQLSPEQIFDSLAISINGPQAWNLELALDVSFADLDTNYRLTLRNGVLVQRQVPADPSTVTICPSRKSSVALPVATTAGT